MNAFRDSNQTREKITAACEAYIMQNGFRGTTMDELAEIIGFSKKTIYVYFPTKAAILEAVLERRFETVFTTLDQVREAHANAPVEAFVAVLERWHEILAGINPLLWREIQLEPYKFLETTAQHRRKIVHEIYGRIIREGITSGDFRTDMKPELIADIIIATLEGFLGSGKCKEYNLAPKELMVTLVRLMIEGSLTERGHATLKTLNLPAKLKHNA